MPQADSRHVPIVINDSAGSARAGLTPQLQAVNQWLEDHAEQLQRTHPSGLREQVERLIEQGFRRIAIGGGDGTLSSVADLFADHDVELVALPLGTLNHFCKDVGLPLEPAGWDALLESDRTRRVDIGRVNDEVFLNNFSLGVYPELVRIRQRLPDEKLFGSKRLGTLYASCKLLNARRSKFSVSWSAEQDGGQTRSGLEKASAVLVSNNAYADEAGAPTARSTLQQSRLVVYIPQDLTLTGMLRMLEHAISGTLDECEDLLTLSCNELELATSSRARHVAIDGEVRRMSGPLRASSVGRVLQVVVG